MRYPNWFASNGVQAWFQKITRPKMLIEGV